jgi:uncharacterized protein YqeY
MADLTAAMKSGDTDTRDTLRGLTAAFKQVEVDSGQTLDEAGVEAVVMKQAKQRRESIDEYSRAGRTDLVEQEEIELAVLEHYIPQMMSQDDIEVIAAQAISDLGVTDVRGMGQVMGKLMPLLRGKADGRDVNIVVRRLLS